MANTPIEFREPSGLTLTADLVAADDSSVATALAATELTNGLGRYRVTYTGTATGRHTLHVKLGTSVIGVFDYDLADTTTVHYPVQVQDSLDDLSEADTVLGTSYNTLRVKIADFLGWSRNSEGAGSGWTGDESHRLDDILNDGYMQFLYPPILPNETTAHRWTFLRPTGTFDTVASTYLYDLDSDFGSIVGDLVFDEDEDITHVLRHVSPGLIDHKRAIDDAEGRPTMFAIRPKAHDQTAQQEQEIMLYPTPDDAYGLIYHYDARVAPLSSANAYPLGGQAHIQTILQSCRDIASQAMRDDPVGGEHARFLERLQASVEYDRRNSPSFLGYNTDNGGRTVVHRHGTEFTCSLSHNLGGGS